MRNSFSLTTSTRSRAAPSKAVLNRTGPVARGSAADNDAMVVTRRRASATGNERTELGMSENECRNILSTLSNSAVALTQAC